MDPVTSFDNNFVAGLDEEKHSAVNLQLVGCKKYIKTHNTLNQLQDILLYTGNHYVQLQAKIK